MNKKILSCLLLISCTLNGWSQPGTPDNTFGENGIVISDFGFSNQSVVAVTLQDDKKIVAAGMMIMDGNPEYIVIRYLPTGEIDSLFGINGYVHYSLNSLNVEENIIGCAIQSDGKIIVAGSIKQWNNFDYLWNVSVHRLNMDGSPDPNFGSNGKFQTDASDNIYEYANAMVLQPDDKILIGGSYSTFYGGGGAQAMVIRLTADGIYDTGFGTNGTVITQVDAFENTPIKDITVQPDGKIVACGENLFFAIRYESNGTIDVGFGSNGVATINLSPDLLYIDVKTMAIQPDGKILIGGNFVDSLATSGALVRYNNDGSADLTFGNNGMAVLSVAGASIFCASVLAQQDGKILFGCTSTISNYENRIFLVRYTQIGLPDSSFGTNAITIVSIGFSTICRDGILDSDGKIILVGRVTPEQFAPSLFTLVRLNNNITSGVGDEILVQKVPLLEQNYPNPFHTVTTIVYHLPSSAAVTLKVFDLYGRQIAAIIDEVQSAGKKSIIFDASNIESGMYFYQLKTNGSTVLKPMQVIHSN